MKLLVVFFSLGLGLVMADDCNVADANFWDYKDFTKWCDDSVSGGLCCPASGTGKQSPIDFVTASIQEDCSLLSPAPCFSGGYFKAITGKLKNTGHSAKFTPDDVNSPAAVVTGGPFGDKKYQFGQFHLHWGADATRGSEHTIDGQTFAGEIHLVHFNQEYGSIGDALAHPDGLAVIGVLLENINSGTQTLIEAVNNAFTKSTFPCGSEFPASFRLSDLFKDIPDMDKFFTYSGSLTTPTCNESVTWLVFKDPIQFGAAWHMRKFRLTFSAKSMSGTSTPRLVDNYRLPQPLDGRVVRCSKA